MRAAMGAIGRFLIAIGLLVLLFVAYQLWGTGIYTSRAQDDLQTQFERRSPVTTSVGGPASSAPPPTTAPPTPSSLPPPPEVPPSGKVVARLVIPRLALNQYVVEGVAVADLRKGPGHYTGTPLPGEPGNAAIAGHRTTYGAPFGNLDELQPGDRLVIEYPDGTSFEFRVDTSEIVEPGAVGVLDPTADPAKPGTNFAQLTLTTCHPRFSAAERLVVKASLAPGVAAFAATPVSPDDPAELAQSLDVDLSGESSSTGPTVLWGIIVALVGAAWWLLFHRHPSAANWFLGAVPFLLVLFVFFGYLERVLPANY